MAFDSRFFAINTNSFAPCGKQICQVCANCNGYLGRSIHINGVRRKIPDRGSRVAYFNSINLCSHIEVRRDME